MTLKCHYALLPFLFFFHCFHSRISQIVLRILKQFSDMPDTFRESEIEFVEISRSSWKFQTVVGSLKQFSKVLNSSWKSQKVSRSFKRFSEVSNSSLKSQTFPGSFHELLGVKKKSRDF